MQNTTRAHRIAACLPAALALSAALSALPAAAQSVDGPGPMFERLDANGDGAVDAGEIASARERMFARIDANGDGLLTADERAAARDQFRQRVAERISQRIRAGGRLAEQREARLAAADLNGDGALSRSEFLGADMPFLAQADADGDGRVTAAEWQAAAARIGAARP